MNHQLSSPDIIELFKSKLPSEISKELALYYDEAIHPRIFCLMELFYGHSQEMDAHLKNVNTDLRSAIFEYLKIYYSSSRHQYDSKTNRWTYNYNPSDFAPIYSDNGTLIGEYPSLLESNYTGCYHFIVELPANRCHSDTEKIPVYVFKNKQLRKYHLKMSKNLTYNTSCYEVPPECQHDESFSCPIFPELAAFQFPER